MEFQCKDGYYNKEKRTCNLGESCVVHKDLRCCNDCGKDVYSNCAHRCAVMGDYLVGDDFLATVKEEGHVYICRECADELGLPKTHDFDTMGAFRFGEGFDITDAGIPAFCEKPECKNMAQFALSYDPGTFRYSVVKFELPNTAEDNPDKSSILDTNLGTVDKDTIQEAVEFVRQTYLTEIEREELETAYLKGNTIAVVSGQIGIREGEQVPNTEQPSYSLHIAYEIRFRGSVENG